MNQAQIVCNFVNGILRKQLKKKSGIIMYKGVIGICRFLYEYSRVNKDMFEKLDATIIVQEPT